MRSDTRWARSAHVLRAPALRGVATIAMVAVAVGALLAAGWRPARAGEETSAPRALDTAQVRQVLGAARGANATMCALAAMAVDGRWGWGMNGMGDAPLGLDDGATAELLRAMRDAEAGPAASVAPLRAALADPDPCVRRFAAPMLGRVRTAAAVDAMLEALRGAGAEEREAAAVALGFAESERGVAPLVAVLARDAEASVRAAAAYALGRIERPEATEALSAALRGDRDARVRRAAAHALGEIHG